MPGLGITSVTDPLGHTWTLSLDGNGNIQTITDPLGHQVTATYNGQGQMASIADALNDTTHFGYTNGDLTSIADPLGNTSYFFSDAAGRTIWTEDPLGSTTNLSYSPLDDLTQSMDTDGNLTKFSYDQNSNLKTVTDANGGLTSYSFDPMNREISRTDPLGVTETYGYDVNGNLTGHTDRRAEVTVYQYDGINRRKFAGFGYTGSSYESTITYSWDGGDHLTQTVDLIAGTIMRQYNDGLDDLTDEQTPQGEVGYLYDVARRRQSMTVVGQPTVSYGWDNANRLTGITQGTSSVVIGYDNANRRTSLTLPNGVTVGYTPDQGSRVTAITFSAGGSQLGNLSYGYDADGRVTSKGGTLAATGLPASVSGNIFNADNEMTGFGAAMLSYDANGNLITDGTNIYTWDARNHLTAITGENTASFVYDALGRRVEKTINSTSTQFLYDRLNPVQELQDAVPSANLLTGLRIDEYFARTDSGNNVSTLLTDALGSTIGLVNSAQTIATGYAYEPFGTTATGAANGNSYQFTGRENDNTGLYFYRARYYSSTLQRFIAQDPIGFFGGSSNLYAYVHESPTAFIDPFGLCWFYEQSTGEMAHIDASGNIDDVELGYAGNGTGLNNPSQQNLGDVGPPPQGVYIIGPQQLNVTQNGTRLPASMQLTPLPSNQMFGRGGFLIHGPHANDHFDSSNGCPVFNRPSRDAIGDSGDDCLGVIP